MINNVITENIKKVLSQRRYLSILLLTCILTFIVLYSLTLATTTGYSLDVFIIMNGLLYTVLTFSAFIGISLLFGLYMALAVFYFKHARKADKKNGTGFAGVIVGIFSAGCPMCGSLILGLFGAGLGLFFLPFKGLELKALSLILLSVSVFLISKNLASCKNDRCKQVN